MTKTSQEWNKYQSSVVKQYISYQDIAHIFTKNLTQRRLKNLKKYQKIIQK